jgi:hypothetical protein
VSLGLRANHRRREQAGERGAEQPRCDQLLPLSHGFCPGSLQTSLYAAQ